MPITLNGSGTVSGISVGGLPDGIIQSADLATGVGGKILQVKQAVKTDVSSSSSNSYAVLSDFTQTITTTGSNKVFCQGTFYLGAPSAYSVWIRLVRADANGSTVYPYRGDALNATDRVTCGGLVQYYNYGEVNCSFMFLDTPSGAGTHTYKIEWRSGYSSTTVYMGRNQYSNDSASLGTAPSCLTLMEVAA